MKLVRAGLAPLVLAALALSAPARAESPALDVPAGPGQQALALRVEAGGVRVRACAAAPCTPEGGTLLAPPEGPKPSFAAAKAVVVTLVGGRAIARVDVPGLGEGSAWVALVAAPPAGKGEGPKVLWSGWTGVSRGEHGEEHAADVIVERGPKGARVLVGERRADVTICGRPALVALRAVDPATLELVRGASAQSLGEDELARAVKLSAERARGDAPRSAVRVLRATAASSAFEKKLSALTDGDPATAWSENKSGDGRGEFVSMSAPSEVGITGLDLIVRPTSDVPEGAAPKRFYLATPDAIFAVSMPEDAFRQPPGTRYSVKLPAALHTSCLAVVLDEAYAHGDPRVTLAEIEARTAFDGMAPEALAGALAGGGDRGRAAAALLVRGGSTGIAAAVAAFDKLDPPGRDLAASVVDAAPCRDQVSFFAARFAAASGEDGRPKPSPGDVDPELSHARDRLRRCGRASAPALVALLGKGAPRTRVLAAEELAALAPAEAVPALLDALAHADDNTRRDLRAALARAAGSARAASALRDELAADRLATRTDVVAIDLLRAVGPALVRVEGGAAAFASQSARATSFRARYLLQGPAAELARAGDATATAFLHRSLRADDDAHVRARAAEAAALVPSLAGPLVEALADPGPRVREAALNAFADALSGQSGPSPAQPLAAAALRERLAHDDWTFVRAGAAHTLGALPADVENDRALAAALADTSPDVRGRALEGIGAHHAVAYAAAVQSHQDDPAENLEVRARAMLALAAMCDARSLADWTKLARTAKQPMNDQERRLGTTAIAALGQLHPRDLKDRLLPLLDADSPPAAREAARAAIEGKGGCPAR
jgi:HEAT repeat protein